MPQDATVGELFELAIAVERSVEELYRGLQAKFAHHPALVNFWGGYAADEANHVARLEHLRGSLSQEALSTPADPVMLKSARELLEPSVGAALKQVRNLEDAYQLTSRLENSETNAIFWFLISNFSLAQQAQPFLRSQMQSHIAKIADEFPAQFKDQQSRWAVMALE